VSTETIRFPVAGMSCSACVSRITRALRRLDGVDQIHVDLGRETVAIRRVAGAATGDDIAAAILGAGYTADMAAAQSVPEAALHGPLRRLFSR
jgi:Cu+-exporting ATPase